MGQPVTVIEKPSVHAGVVRFETNRALTGMGHEAYRSVADVKGDRPSDQIARAIFAHGGVDAVHVNANVITVHLSQGSTGSGLKEVIENIFLFYREGLAVDAPPAVVED
jgi:hypothetical protein